MNRDHRTDPEWLQAHADFVDDQRPDEVDEDEVYVRRIKAATRLHDIETSYRRRASEPGS